MITKDSTTVVNFYAMNTDGSPATGKTITATISINGAAATAITDTISEVGSGWYKFNHTFSSEGNAFITFSCYGCIIPPWEDDVVEITTTPPPTAAEIAQAVWSDTASYPMTMSSTPKGYYQVYPQIDSPWDIQALSVQGFPVTYGEVIRGTYSLADTIDTRVQATATADALSTVSTNVTSIKSKTDNLPANPAAVGSAMTLTAAYDAAKTASQLTTSDIPSASTIATAVWSDTATYSSSSSKGKKLSKIALDVDDLPTKVWCADLSSFSIATTAGYQVFTALGGCATSSQLASTQTDIIAAIPDISGLSTFDASTDTVLIDATQAAGMTTATGFATANDVSNAEAAIIAAIPTVPTDYAKAGDTMALSSTDINSIRSGLATGTDITNAQAAVINAIPDVSGLSTFDATTDRVIIDATQAATMETATGFATPADIPSASAVAEAVWDTDLTDITASDTAAKQIYTALSNCATATDTAVLSAELDEILGGVLHWSVNYNTLTVYGPNNTPIRTYSITRDENGNIAQLTPNG